MYALDTNIIVRFIARDDETQLQKVETFLTDLEHNDERAFVPSLVILETIWVLSSAYQATRIEIIETLLTLLKMPVLHIEHSEQLQTLLDIAQAHTFDLSDLMVAYRCQTANALPVITFDKKAAQHDLFQLLR